MKRLIVCADGTWNTPDQKDNGKPAPTNVWKFFNAVDKCRTAPDGVVQVDERALMPPLAVDEHQHLVGAEPAQRGRSKFSHLNRGV